MLNAERCVGDPVVGRCWVRGGVGHSFVARLAQHFIEADQLCVGANCLRRREETWAQTMVGILQWTKAS